MGKFSPDRMSNNREFMAEYERLECLFYQSITMSPEREAQVRQWEKEKTYDRPIACGQSIQSIAKALPLHDDYSENSKA